MTLYSGTKKIGSLFFGTQSIAKAYRGDNLVFQKAEPIPFKFLYADMWYGYPTPAMESVARIRWYAEGDAKSKPFSCRYSRKETSAQDYPNDYASDSIMTAVDGGHYWGHTKVATSYSPGTMDVWNRVQDVKIVAVKQDGSILDEIEFRTHPSFGHSAAGASYSSSTATKFYWNPISSDCEYMLQYVKM